MQTTSPTKLKLSLASANDIPSIVALAEKIWQAHYPPIIGHAQVDYMLKTMYSDAAIAQDIQKGQEFRFIDNEEGRAGYMAWSYRGKDELFIHKFYIDASLQGKGIGRIAFMELLELNPGIKTIRLTVNRKNYKSINFYYRVGFTIEEVADFDIGDGYFMNDFVMRWNRG